MRKISQIILKILLITIIIQAVFIPIPSSEASFWGDIFETGDGFVENGKEQGVTIDGQGMKTEMDRIYNILLALGVVIAVLVGAILGIRYMFGGIEEQVKVKETLFPYVIGCVLIFGAFGIWKIVVTILTTLS